MKSRLLNVLAVAMPLAIPALAHHSFTMFDATKQITHHRHGHVFRVDQSPLLHRDRCAGRKRRNKALGIEMGSPSILQQSGWKFSSLKKGDKTTLVINPLKDGRAGGFLNEATLPNGKVLGNGPGRGPQK